MISYIAVKTVNNAVTIKKKNFSIKFFKTKTKIKDLNELKLKYCHLKHAKLNCEFGGYKHSISINQKLA